LRFAAARSRAAAQHPETQGLFLRRPVYKNGGLTEEAWRVFNSAGVTDVVREAPELDNIRFCAPSPGPCHL
jgi:hypothetical protein